MNTEINNRDNDEISLKELIEKGKWYSYLLSQWKIIVLAGIMRAVLGRPIRLSKPVYTATLSLALEDENRARLGALGLGSLGLDLGGGGGSIFTGSNLTGIVQVSRWWNKPC
jgi:hypothetical protein